MRDPLTGAFNRRYLDEVMEDLINRKEPFAFLIMDIDNFKNFNDTNGHPAGDEALKRLVIAVDNVIRIGRPENLEDVLARYGGEEFVVVLRKVDDPKKALEISEKIRSRIEGSRFANENNNDLKVTISGGLTVYDPKEHISEAIVIERADKALYEAKNNGKNRVLLFNKKDNDVV